MGGQFLSNIIKAITYQKFLTWSFNSVLSGYSILIHSHSFIKLSKLSIHISQIMNSLGRKRVKYFVNIIIGTFSYCSDIGAYQLPLILTAMSHIA